MTKVILKSSNVSAADNNHWQHKLPTLPYSYSALEPAIDRQTLKFHYAVHHRACVKQLNLALHEYPHLKKKSAQWLLLNLEKIPAEIRQLVNNNAGGHVNHSLLWLAMSPTSLGNVVDERTPQGALAAAVIREFGTFDFFQTLFTNTAVSLFGSGWVWLVYAEEDGGRLELMTTSGNDNPLAQGCYPILLCDVWEHAYDLQHQHDRRAYVQQWWDVVNWREAERRYVEASSRIAALPPLATLAKMKKHDQALWRHAA